MKPLSDDARRRQLEAADKRTEAEIEAGVAADPDLQGWDGRWEAVPDVRALLSTLGLSAAAFAERYDLGVHTVTSWAQGRRNPDRTARSLLRAIARDPEGMAALIA